MNVMYRLCGLPLLFVLIVLQGCATSSSAPVSDVGRIPPASSTPAKPSVPESTGGSVDESHAAPAPSWKPDTQARTTLPAVIQLLQRAQELMANYAWDEAILAAERGLRIDARNPALYLVLAKSYGALGQTGKARLFAEQGRSLSYSDAEMKSQFDDILAELIHAS